MNFQMSLTQLRQMMVQLKTLTSKQQRTNKDIDITIHTDTRRNKVRFIATQGIELVFHHQVNVKNEGVAFVQFSTLDSFLQRSIKSAKEKKIKELPCDFIVEDELLTVRNSETHATESQFHYKQVFNNHLTHRQYKEIKTDPILFSAALAGVIDMAISFSSDPYTDIQFDVQPSELNVYGTNGRSGYFKNIQWYEADTRSVTRLYNALPQNKFGSAMKCLRMKSLNGIKLAKLFNGEEVIEFKLMQKADRFLILRLITNSVELAVEIDNANSLKNLIQDGIKKFNGPSATDKKLSQKHGLGYVPEFEYVSVQKETMIETLKAAKEYAGHNLFTGDEQTCLLRFQAGAQNCHQEDTVTVVSIPDERDCYFEATIDSREHLFLKSFDAVFNIKALINAVSTVTDVDGWIDFVLPVVSTQPTHVYPILIVMPSDRSRCLEISEECVVLLPYRLDSSTVFIHAMKAIQEEDEES